MAESWVGRRSEEFRQLPIRDEDLATAQRYLSFVRQARRTRKSQDGGPNILELVKDYRQQRDAIIFYAGQNDYRSGMRPRSLPAAHLHSPFFESTTAALEYLARLAAANNWQLLFKPHPNIQDRQALYTGPHSDHVTVVVGANIFDCMAHTDLTVTILSQVSYLTLIHNRPVLLLGRNQLSGKGCIYEVERLDDIEATIKTALQNGFSVDQQHHWWRHVAQLCKYYLFAMDEDVAQLLGRGPDGAAAYLVQQARSAGRSALANSTTGPLPGNMMLRLAALECRILWLSKQTYHFLLPLEARLFLRDLRQRLGGR